MIYAQSKIIENASFRSWNVFKPLNPDVPCTVSKDGSFFAYKYGLLDNTDSLSIQKIDGGIIGRFANVQDVQFAKDSRYCIFSCGTDTLVVVNLSRRSVTFFDSVSSFVDVLIQHKSYLIYRATSGSLKVMRLVDGRTITIANTINYEIREDANLLFATSKSELFTVDLPNFQLSKVFVNGDISALRVNRTASQCVLAIDSSKLAKIVLYDLKKGTQQEIVSDIELLRKGNLKIDKGRLDFSDDLSRIYFNVSELKQSDSATTLDSSPEVLTNASKNVGLRPALQNRLSLFVYSLKTNLLSQIVPSTKRVVVSSSTTPKYKYDFIVAYDYFNEDELYWNKEHPSFYLISAIDGKIIFSRPISKSLHWIPPVLAPNGKFLVWYDFGNRQYMSYNISTQKLVCISQKLPYILYNSHSDIKDRESPYGIAGWWGKSSVILLYDQFDIWEVDLDGNMPPANITGGCGRSNNTVIRIVKDDKHLENELVLSLFDIESKRNGFAKIIKGKSFKFRPNSLGDYIYCGNSSFSTVSRLYTYHPQRINGSQSYIVFRMSSKEAPNLYLTNDFVNYTQLTNFHPQTGYNWFETGLINWRLPNGQKAQGIIYYPQKINLTQKYPVVIQYYEKRSDELNEFLFPIPDGAEINIPWYTSHGFIVFQPDIHYSTGNNRKFMSDAMDSCIGALTRLPYVDSTRLGLYGHSQGAYQTLVFLSSSSRYKAAIAFAGPTNEIMAHGWLFGGNSGQNFTENGQPNLGTTPWDNPSVYVENSPIFFVNKINVPLLMIHNRDDQNVPFQHGAQLFLALRRLNKPVWFLQYPNEGHVLWEFNNVVDYNLKQQQFFQYFLQGFQCPVWMK